MNLLKRELAPILPEAWEAIDEEARRVLTMNLGGRKLVDFDGPHGWNYAAVNLGRLEKISHESDPDVEARRRLVQPLIELRSPFHLPVQEMDDVARGADNPDLDAVRDAAEKIARSEDHAIFNGYDAGGIIGIIGASPHPSVPLPDSAADYPAAVVRAREVLRAADINGPYALALGTAAYNELSQAAVDGYPVRKRIEGQIIAGPIVRVPAIEGGVLLSMRGGDFCLTVGQDLSIGYRWHNRDDVELFITESFTFRVLEPAAAVVLAHTSPLAKLDVQ